MLSKYLTTSNEAIEHQREQALFHELTVIVEDLRDGGGIGDFKKDVQNSIREHTNLQVDLKTSDFGMGASVIPWDINPNNPLYANVMNHFSRSRVVKKNMKKHSEQVGWVDRKNSKVEGVYKDIETKIYIDGLHRNLEFKPEEVAAVVLHEVGHLFTYCEQMTQTVMRNLTLTVAANEVTNNGDYQERAKLIDTISKEMNYDNIDVKDLAESTDASAVSAVLIREADRKTRSSSNSYTYDITAWESGADQFAVRHGAGKALATALGRMSRTEQQLKSALLLHRGIMVACLTFLAGIKSAVIITGITLVGIPILMAIIWVRFIGDPNMDAYDPTRQRFKRIRQETLSALKDANLSKEDYRQILDQLDTIEEIEKSYIDARPAIVSIATNLIGSYSKEYKQRVLQKDLEELVNSKAYQAAALLKQ